uniref:DNA-directed DNA polymerase n=1 Tax=Macrostomum lignano TaxID=282301 RepID=A0A1I8JKY1_9PLAT
AVILGRKVKGFDEATNIVLQFHGCFYHGCEQYMPDQDVVHPLKRQPLSHIRHETERFTRELERHNYSVRVIWEHEYDTVLASQADFIAATAHLRAPLKMEDALYGGRVECFIPHAMASDTEALKYQDVVSLYPTVQSKDAYPIGHPVHHPTPQTLDSDALASYFGIAEVTVLPPSDLHIPLLPYRVQKKLIFGLCRTCMEQQQEQCSRECCSHSDQERALT